MTNRRCSGCGSDRFVVTYKKQPTCRACMWKDIRRKSPLPDRSPVAVRKTKPCSKCRRRLTLDKFYRRTAAPDGRGAYCQECVAVWHEANKEWKRKTRDHELASRAEKMLRGSK